MLDYEQRTVLTDEEVEQIRTAMHLYEDFLQKKKAIHHHLHLASQQSYRLLKAVL